MRLDKYLADMNVGTRKELKKLIRDCRVTVDNEVIRDPGFTMSGNEVVCVDGSMINYSEFEYYMLNKPAGVISASEDKKKTTVLDLLDERRRKDLFPVGRLDIDTVGLLIITNDGDLTHRLLSPKKHVDKTYYAEVNGEVNETHAAAFKNGLTVDESLTAMPADLHILSSSPALSKVEITIREGKFHQIKRMFEAIGMEVVYLKRLSMGPVQLDPSLPEGEFRRLTDEEVSLLQNCN